MKYWNNLTPASCLPDCWCEHPRFDSWLVEPSNTISGLVFFIIAFFVFQRFKKIDPFHKWLFISAQVVLALGTVAYHMTLSFEMQWADLLGMYLVVLFYCLYQYQTEYKFSNKKFFWY